jgi:hypothetical protein
MLKVKSNENNYCFIFSSSLSLVESLLVFLASGLALIHAVLQLRVLVGPVVIYSY